jgi:hypothetical protein
MNLSTDYNIGDDVYILQYEAKNCVSLTGPVSVTSMDVFVRQDEEETHEYEVEIEEGRFAVFDAAYVFNSLDEAWDLVREHLNRRNQR